MPRWFGLPHRAVEHDYAAPPELGGLRANYPIVTNVQTRGLMHEVLTDWDQTIMGGENIGVAGVEQYYGDVWSIQLTARPGYYVSPDVLEAMGYGNDNTDPIG